MNREFLLQILLLAITTPLLGSYLAGVFTGRFTFFKSFEKVCYTIGGVNPDVEMSAWEYAKTLLYFNLWGFLALFLLLLLQGSLPFNPQHFPGVSWPLAFNIASSFVTNTNWQSYTPETTLSYFSQMAGLTTQNFLSCATGLAALRVLIRGFTRKKVETVGNFWVDLVRALIYLLLPLALLFSLLLVHDGVIQNYSAYVELSGIEQAKQTVALGPVASQVAIKQLGTNGGGFFHANSAHPFENPTGLTNFLEGFACVMIPAALVYMFGVMIGSKKRALLLFYVMLGLLIVGLGISFLTSSHSFEGKETRIGVANSLLWSVLTTGSANGSTNAALSSLAPISGAVCLFNMMLGELLFGGVGAGLINMLMFAVLTVFFSGLLVGKSPEYLGKKIEKSEMQWVMISIITPIGLILLGTGLTLALSSISHAGPHGLSEVLYAFTSAAKNNGSSFAGLHANTDYYNIILGLIMLLARVAVIVPAITVGGLLAKKRMTPTTLGTFTTDSPLFVLMLVAVILLIGALTFFPSLALGPIAEEILMHQKRAF